MFFNPLRYINPAKVEQRVRNLRLDNPDLTNRELSLLVIKERGVMCALSGVVTTLPAIFPVIGTLITLVGGIAIDIYLIGYFMMRMVMEIAVINGHKLTQHGLSREMLWVFASAVGADAASKTISRISVSQMSNQAVVKIIQQVLLSLGIRSTPRLAVRVIPLMGAGIAGAINYSICKKVGQAVFNHYGSPGGGAAGDVKETIDVIGEVQN